MSERRLVTVLGYSRGAGVGLHPVCAARLERAALEATAADAMLFSGWARRRRRRPEAELMAEAWSGAATRVLLDRGARSTSGNARAVARVARDLAVDEVVIVTSSWHGRRAAALVRTALSATGPRVVLVATDEPSSLGTRIRELVCWTLVPVQAALAARAS